MRRCALLQDVTNDTIKMVMKRVEQTKTDRSHMEFRRSAGSSGGPAKFFTPIQQNVMSPTNK